MKRRNRWPYPIDEGAHRAEIHRQGFAGTCAAKRGRQTHTVVFVHRPSKVVTQYNFATS